MEASVPLNPHEATVAQQALWLTSLLVLMYQWRGEKPFVFSRAASHLGPDAVALFPELFPSGLAVLNLAVPRLIMCSEPLLQQQAFCAEASFANPPYACHQ